MKDGLYKVQFTTQLGSGAGVVVLRDGRLYGGDSGMHYVGDYTLNENHFAADVRTDRHTSNLSSVLDVDRAHITLTGTYSNESVEAEGSARENPGVSFRANLQFLCD